MNEIKNNFIEHELIKKSSQLHNKMITFASFVNTEVNNKYENNKVGLVCVFLLSFLIIFLVCIGLLVALLHYFKGLFSARRGKSTQDILLV